MTEASCRERGENTLIGCVPVAECPDFPSQAPYSVYEITTCDFCSRKVWLGTRCKAKVEEGYKKICPYCLAAVSGDDLDENLSNTQQLTDLDGVA